MQTLGKSHSSKTGDAALANHIAVQQELSGHGHFNSQWRRLACGHSHFDLHLVESRFDEAQVVELFPGLTGSAQRPSESVVVHWRSVFQPADILQTCVSGRVAPVLSTTVPDKFDALRVFAY